MVGDICPKCNQPIQSGEEVHPVFNPVHVQCRNHRRCYTLCDPTEFQ